MQRFHGKPQRGFPVCRKIFSLAAILIFVFGVSGCSKLKARDLLNKGVAAFKNAQFDTAVEDFKQAKELDPDLINARLYLATAYASQYIPGAPLRRKLESRKTGNRRISERPGNRPQQFERD